MAAPKTPSDLFLKLDTTTTYQFLSDDTLPARPARCTQNHHLPIPQRRQPLRVRQLPSPHLPPKTTTYQFLKLDSLRNTR